MAQREWHDQGGPAFAHGDREHGGDPGMSLRDWFAGQAAMGMATSAGWQGAPWNKIAEDSYRLADALLLARETQHFAEEKQPF